MKATAVKAQTKNTPKHAAHGGVQCKARAGASNHHRAFGAGKSSPVQMDKVIPNYQAVTFTRDRLEQEADQAAEQFLRGEKGIGRRLTHIQAAEFETSESRGAPLSGLLLRELEHGFGADLTQVRLHRGKVASEFSEELGATAFAAGRDIYLSNAAPHIMTSAGRRLIAHEVAHTIQQTGRVSTGNRVAVTKTRGRRRPQLAYKSPLKSTPEDYRPTFDQLVEVYHLYHPTNKKVLAEVDLIKKERDAAVTAGTEPDFWTTLEKETKDDKAYDSSARELKSFIFDALKLSGKIAGAVYLLERDLSLSSTFFLKEVYEALPAVGYSWLATFWNASSFFVYTDKTDPKKSRDLSPLRFQDTFAHFLFGATRDIPDLSPNGDFQTLITEELKKHEAPAGLIGNELYFITLWAVKEADQIRLKKLGDLAKKEASVRAGTAAFAQWLSPTQRKSVAAGVLEWAKTLATATPDLTNLSEEVKFIYNQMAKPIEDIATNAVTFWEKVELFEIAVRSGQTIEGMTIKPATLIKKFADRGEFQKFREALRKAALKQFELKPLNPDSEDWLEQTIFPTPADYEAARSSFIKTMRNAYWFQFESKLFAELRKPPPPEGKKATSKHQNFQLAIAYGWVASRLYDLIAVLDEYIVEDDEAFANAPETLGRADLRIDHRTKLATWLWFFGNVVGWEEFMVLGNAVISAQQKGQELSQIAIIGDWTEDKVPIGKLTEDFGAGNVVKTWEPLTFADVSTYYKTLRMSNLTDEIIRLSKEPGAFDPSHDTTLVSRAIKGSDKANAKLYPRRFQADRYVLNIRPDDLKSGQYAAIVRSHPKTQALLKRERPEHGDSFVPDKPSQGMFLWIVPTAIPFIKLLQGFDEFNTLIFKSTVAIREPTNEELQPIRTMEPLPWFQALAHAGRMLDPTIVKEARKKVSSKLRELFAIAKIALRETMRKASILERVSRTITVLRPGLSEYERYDQMSPATKLGGVIFEIPGKVLSHIGAIASGMAPVEEQNWHYAAMFLELAQLMNEKFKDNPRPDVANEYLPAINVVLEEVATSKDSILMIMPGRTATWVDTQAATLKSLNEILRTKLLTGQMAFGLVGHAEGATQFVSGISEGGVINAKRDPPRETFTIDGVIWAVLEVHKNFTFHPRYGALDALLYVDDKEVPADERTESLVLVTVQFGASGPERKLTADPKDEELLAKLSYAVTMELIVRQLEELAEFMKGFAELTLEALEFIPGAGQAVMAARLAIAILTFIASGEAQMYVDALTKDPLGEIQRVLGLLTSLFQPDELWQFLLLGNNKFDQLHSKPKATGTTPAPKSTVQKFLRLMSRIWNLGEGVLGSVGRMQSHVRWGVESTQLTVLKHPLLAGALRWVSNHLEQIVQVTLMAIAIGEKLIDTPTRKEAPEESEGDLTARFNSAVNELPDRINSVALQLGELHLPDQLLPLGEVVEVITQILISRLGAKYRIVAGVIFKLLDLAGKKDEIFRAVAGLIPAEADPNTYWKKEVVEPVTPWLNTAKDELIDSFYDQILKFDFFKAKKDVLEGGRSAAKSASVSVKTADLPESTVQPYARGKGMPSGPNVGALPPPGKPLSPSIRRSAEMRFGHDFGHVRLSTGSAANNFTKRIGADALTSGSNVYLRNGLSPVAGSGKRVLDHELVHVLQQTGPRPIGGNYGNRPRAVSRGRGLLFDPVSERAADRVAGVVGSRRKGGPVSTGKTRTGWQPALPYNIIRGLLDDVTSTGDIEADEAKVDITGATEGLKKLSEAQKHRIQDFSENLKTAIGAANNFEAPFNHTTGTDIPAAIKDHLLTGGPAGDPNFTAIEKAIADLAGDSLRYRKAKEGEVKDTEPQVISYIDSSRLAIALARYVFGRTGVLINFTLLPNDKDDEATVITCSKMQVVYVHLPPVRANHRLWTAAVEGLSGRNKEEKDLLADKDKLFRRLRLYLAAKGPAPGIWKPKAYGLQQRVLSELVEFVKAMAAGGADLAPSDLPSKKDYLHPDTPSTALGHIGLRLGTYKGSGNQQGRDRESHHTTQFLLLEYFAHQNDTQTSDNIKPFPLIAKKADVYPGLDATTQPSKFTGPTTMDIQGLVKGVRGDSMPAILISRPTHRAGNLHVTTKADDFEDKVDSPASVVNFIFHEKLGGDDGEYRKAEKAGVAAFEAYRVAKGDEAVKKQTYDAMQGTYKWMRDLMRERLDNALPGIELKYYNQLAEDGGKNDRLKSGEMTLVAAAAKQNNDSEMKKWGWTG